MGSSAPESITFEEYLACSRIAFEWATSYDTKDWPRLRAILSPTLQIDYTSVMGPTASWPSMTASAFVSMMSSAHQLGNISVATQHLLGGSTWERTSTGDVVGLWQLRALHLRFGGEGKEVLAKGVGHAVVRQVYRKGESEGGWKLAGLKPEVLIDEGDIANVFGRV